MKVLIATDKPFAKVAVDGIRKEIEAAGYELAASISLRIPSTATLANGLSVAINTFMILMILKKRLTTDYTDYHRF